MLAPKRIAFVIGTVLCWLGIVGGLYAQAPHAPRLQKPLLTATVTRTPTSEPTSLQVLRAVAQDMGCRNTTFTAYELHCAPSAGHALGVNLRHFDTASEACAAFGCTTATETFQGHLARSSDYYSPPGSTQHYQTLNWQADRWLVDTSTFNDTRFGASAQGVSGSVYTHD